MSRMKKTKNGGCRCNVQVLLAPPSFCTGDIPGDRVELIWTSPQATSTCDQWQVATSGDRGVPKVWTSWTSITIINFKGPTSSSHLHLKGHQPSSLEHRSNDSIWIHLVQLDGILLEPISPYSLLHPIPLRNSLDVGSTTGSQDACVDPNWTPT